MSQKIVIGFTGDTAFSEYTKEFYQMPKNLDKKIYSFLNKNDYNIINFESPVTASLKTAKASLAHKSDAEALDYIKDNFKNPIISLANNHMMDFGIRGLLDTIDNVENRGLQFLGAGRDVDEATKYVILGDDIKVGVLSFQYKDTQVATSNSPGTAHDKHEKIIKKKIKKLKSLVDWVVVIYHGGEEFINAPMPYTRRRMKKMLRWGANIVVGHHPHTVQGYERFGQKMIFYSLGNFIFDTDYQRAQIGTEYGEIIRLTFTKDNYSFENLDIYNNREKGKILVSKPYEHFKLIKKGYRNLWKKEAIKFLDIKKKKKKLSDYRKLYLVKELYIEKTKCDNYLSFEELIKKHNFDGIDRENKFDSKLVRLMKRYIKKIKNIEYRKYFYMMYAKVFR